MVNIRIHYSIELNQRPLVSIRSRKKGLGQLLAITPFIDPVPLINQSTPFVCSFKMENSQGCSLCQQSGRVVTPQEPTIKQILGHSSCQKSSENEKGFSVKERPRGARRALWGKVHPEERVISANKYRGGPALDENAELVGRFLWLKKLPLAQLLGQGLNTQICDHPFLVVDHHKDLVRPGQKPTGYLKVCMVSGYFALIGQV